MHWFTSQDIEAFARMAEELRRVAAEVRSRAAPPAGSPPSCTATQLEDYAAAILRDLNLDRPAGDAGTAQRIAAASRTS